MNGAKKIRNAYLKYSAAMLLSSTNGVVASLIELSSYEIVFLRALLGFGVLCALFFATGRRLTFFRHKRDAAFLALSGVAQGANWLFLFEGYDHIGVSLVTLINYFGPVIIIAFTPLLLKEKLVWPKLLALIAALSGVFLISGQAAVEGLSPWGLLCAGLSAFGFAAMVLCNKLSKHIDGMEASTILLFFSALTVTVFLGCKQGFCLDISVADWPPVLWLGLMNTGLSAYCYFSSINVLPAQTVAVCGYLEMLCAVLLSVVLLHETMLPLQILGAALVLGGALFGECYHPKTPPAAKDGPT